MVLPTLPNPLQPSNRASEPLFAATLFISAALLFLVEPMFAKMVLPFVGGTPAVWNTCLVFFQAALLGGYSFAHFVCDRIQPRAQALTQCTLFVTGLAVLPISISPNWTPPAGRSPIPWILLLATAKVGLPFFALGTMAPTMQKWYARIDQTADPYFLYSASNIGSLAALLSYPFVLEPLLHLHQQAQVWTWGYGILVALLLCCSALFFRTFAPPLATFRQSGAFKELLSTEVISLKQGMTWVFLAFVPSSLLLGVTTIVTTDIPPVPFLWVVPLVIYLLTFIFVFAKRPPIWSEGIGDRLPFLLLAVVFTQMSQVNIPIPVLLALNWLAFFVAAMVCHGELARSRPSAANLTQFYLLLAIGGVLGGIFNGLIAPLIFRHVTEYLLALVLAAFCRFLAGGKTLARSIVTMDFVLPGIVLLLCVMLVRVISVRGFPHWAQLLAFVPSTFICLSFGKRPLRFALGLGALIFSMHTYSGPYDRELYAARSFFGVYRVMAEGQGQRILLLHGSTIHGIESLNPDLHGKPLGYYTQSGPVGQLFAELDASGRQPPVAVIGLGAGMLASYAKPEQPFTFFEIDPLVERLARDERYFTFLRDSPGTVRVIIGDARQSLLQESQRRYGLIVIDAFSSDSIPMHLLTREALNLYLDKLGDGGMLALNISNRYLDFEPVVANLAHDAGLVGWVRNHTNISEEEFKQGHFPSIWIVLVRKVGDAPGLARNPQWQQLRRRDSVGVWTDDFSNLIRIVRWD